jgi:hypothetical protein
MKLTLTIETQDPAELARVAQALNGVDIGPQETQATKPRPSKAAASPAPVAETKAQQTTAAVSVEQAPTADASSEPPTPAALNTAVNAACARLGNGGPAKVKAYIAANFTKPDGTPGGLMSTADAQKSKLLAALNQIAAGTLPL